MVSPGKQPSPKITEEDVISGLFTEREWGSGNKWRMEKHPETNESRKSLPRGLEEVRGES